MVARRGSGPGLSDPACPSDSGVESLTLNLTEVVKRQNPKSKKGFNQVRASLSLKPHPQETYWGGVRTCVCAHGHGVSEEGCPRLWGLWVGGEAG